jgi:hypothetical protein
LIERGDATRFLFLVAGLLASIKIAQIYSNRHPKKLFRMSSPSTTSPPSTCKFDYQALANDMIFAIRYSESLQLGGIEINGHNIAKLKPKIESIMNEHYERFKTVASKATAAAVQRRKAASEALRAGTISFDEYIAINDEAETTNKRVREVAHQERIDADKIAVSQYDRLMETELALFNSWAAEKDRRLAYDLIAVANKHRAAIIKIADIEPLKLPENVFDGSNDFSGTHENKRVARFLDYTIPPLGANTHRLLALKNIDVFVRDDSSSSDDDFNHSSSDDDDEFTVQYGGDGDIIDAVIRETSKPCNHSGVLEVVRKHLMQEDESESRGKKRSLGEDEIQ